MYRWQFHCIVVYHHWIPLYCISSSTFVTMSKTFIGYLHLIKQYRRKWVFLITLGDARIFKNQFILSRNSPQMLIIGLIRKFSMLVIKFPLQILFFCSYKVIIAVGFLRVGSILLGRLCKKTSEKQIDCQVYLRIAL